MCVCPFLLPLALIADRLFAVRLQLQVQKQVAERQYKGPIDCARQICRVQGVKGLWSGLTGSLAFRSNFFWMFLSFEVSEGNLDIKWVLADRHLHCAKVLMRGFSRLDGTVYEVINAHLRPGRRTETTMCR